VLEDHGAEETVLFVTEQPLPQPIAVEVYDRVDRLLDQQPWSVSFPHRVAPAGA
jgi:hypothetical protein